LTSKLVNSLTGLVGACRACRVHRVSKGVCVMTTSLCNDVQHVFAFISSPHEPTTANQLCQQAERPACNVPTNTSAWCSRVHVLGCMRRPRKAPCRSEQWSLLQPGRLLCMPEFTAQLSRSSPCITMSTLPAAPGYFSSNHQPRQDLERPSIAPSESQLDGVIQSRSKLALTAQQPR
jgi:hypothetical protein